MNDSTKKPIINCHAHIFKGEHVPPYLAKTFVPWPFYRLLNTPLILKLYKRSVKDNNEKYQDPYVEKKRNKVIRRIKLQRNKLLNGILSLIGFIVTYHTLFIIFEWLSLVFSPENNDVIKYGLLLQEWLESIYLLYPLKNIFIKTALVAILVLFFKSGRNLIWFILRKTLKFFSVLPGKMTKDLLDRYLLLGRFTLYKDQKRIFSVLESQYPPGSKFIVLPMDMEYMGAGKLDAKSSYKHQMQEIASIKEKGKYKNEILPFVFAEPRRIREEKDHLKFTFDKGKVTLQDCFIKEYIEDKKFNGFKIYPALGYYPFDEALLPLWKYAADRGIPIMTHCIKGTIFYRGKKEKEWDVHPIFKEVVNLENDIYEPLLLPQTKNKDFSLNFTHPLNYLVLLKEELLRILVDQCSDEIKSLFGYKDLNTPLTYNLSHLKICFAHFGGEDQWNKYLEFDRYRYSNELIKEPETGINFLYRLDNKFSWKKLEDCWKYVDWYSIICSMMLQHENVYADISYILHDEQIFPLLRQTINHTKLGKKVLFGTDFYVVRNHAAEKNLVAATTGNLTVEEFDIIARDNPAKFLS
ncbi:amidohydrolase family protein [uncultured Aquimarina sp.]|uniref:amidohydrolase family protein n=1 Tax=uncultured Aquimarina sp. TaxID=575652 RepID=UPI002619C8EE|nr:amidohydrolase family protein [uncultured Aquimarina sp.]